MRTAAALRQTVGSKHLTECMNISANTIFLILKIMAAQYLSNNWTSHRDILKPDYHSQSSFHTTNLVRALEYQSVHLSLPSIRCAETTGLLFLKSQNVKLLIISSEGTIKSLMSTVVKETGQNVASCVTVRLQQQSPARLALRHLSSDISNCPLCDTACNE